MQSNVDLIVASANTTRLFNLATGDAPQELADCDLPALIVCGRRMVNVEAYDTARLYYTGDWEYDVWIEGDYDTGHAAVEENLRLFLLELNGDREDPWFEMGDRIEIGEGYHGQRRIIAAQITLSIPSHYDLQTE